MTTHGKDARAAHVGCYLTAEGKPRLEVAISAHFGPVQTPCPRGRILCVPLYVTNSSIDAFFYSMFRRSRHGAGRSGFMGISIPFTHYNCGLPFGPGCCQWHCLNCDLPQVLLKMDFSTGIPSRLLTLVVVPAIAYEQRFHQPSV